MRYTQKESCYVVDESGLPGTVAGKEEEKGLTPKQKKFLEETMHRHDKALKKLAQM